MREVPARRGEGAQLSCAAVLWVSGPSNVSTAPPMSPPAPAEPGSRLASPFSRARSGGGRVLPPFLPRAGRRRAVAGAAGQGRPLGSSAWRRASGTAGGRAEARGAADRALLRVSGPLPAGPTGLQVERPRLKQSLPCARWPAGAPPPASRRHSGGFSSRCFLRLPRDPRVKDYLFA